MNRRDEFPLSESLHHLLHGYKHLPLYTGRLLIGPMFPEECSSERDLLLRLHRRQFYEFLQPKFFRHL